MAEVLDLSLRQVRDSGNCSTYYPHNPSEKDSVTHPFELAQVHITRFLLLDQMTHPYVVVDDSISVIEKRILTSVVRR